ncbi:MAG: hypothetical protein Hals2KO_21350 [Halioglobus sp.]
MSWYRVHNDILDNPKLLMLAPSDRYYYLAGILSLKSQGVLDEYEGDKLERVICAKLRLTKQEWDECFRRLQEEELVDENCQPINWDKRQFKAASSTERVRKHRAKKKRESSRGAGLRGAEPPPDETLHETFHETPSETLQEGFRNRSETPTDTDTDTDYSEPVNTGSATPVAKPVDNSRLSRAEEFYDSPEDMNLFRVGVSVFAKYRIGEDRARSVIGKLIRDHGKRATIDAVTELVCRTPVGDPIAWLQKILTTPRHEMPLDWNPSPGAVSQLERMGIPYPVINNSRAYFKIWNLERETTSNNFDEWFVEWCIRDFEDAECDAGIQAAWYGHAAAQEFREPAGGTIT